jgi:hypothetical protein
MPRSRRGSTRTARMRHCAMPERVWGELMLLLLLEVTMLWHSTACWRRQHTPTPTATLPASRRRSAVRSTWASHPATSPGGWAKTMAGGTTGGHSSGPARRSSRATAITENRPGHSAARRDLGDLAGVLMPGAGVYAGQSCVVRFGPELLALLGPVASRLKAVIPVVPRLVAPFARPDDAPSQLQQ